MPLAFFHLDHGWRTCKFFECWNDIWDGTINSRLLLVYKTFGHIDALVFWNPLIKPQYQMDRQLTQKKNFKLHILKFRIAMNEKIVNTKIPKLEIKTIRRCGLINHLWKHSMRFLNKKTLDFLMDFPRLTFNIRKVVSSFAIFIGLYLTLIEMLKGTIGVTMVSTNLWYLCLLSLPIVLINYWMLPWMKKTKNINNINNKLKYKKYEKENKQTIFKKKVRSRNNICSKGTCCCAF